MSNLTKGMFADYICDTFGLRYNQIRTDAVIKNAGWFNSQGEKLGMGDLNLEDLTVISNDVDMNEIFVAVPEADCTWDLPGDLDRNAPGIDYVMKNALWVVSGIEGPTEGAIYWVKPSRLMKMDNIPIVEEGTVKYTEVTRDYLYSILEFANSKFSSIKPTPTAVFFFPANYYGLDEYHLTDGTKWAVGNWAQVQDAALKKAEEYLPGYVQDRSLLDKYAPDLSDSEKRIIQAIAVNYPSHCATSLRKLMSAKCVETFCKTIFANKTPAGLLSSDQIEYYSSDFKGLPANLFAFKVSE